MQVQLVEGGHPGAAELLLGGACLAAAAAAFALPSETRGRHLESPELHEEEEQQQLQHNLDGTA